MKQLPKNYVDEILRRGLREDASRKDMTTKALIPVRTQAWAALIAREPLVLCGLPIFIRTLKLQDPRLKVKVYFPEGARIPKGKRVAEVYGPARSLLSAERVALNFLQRLSGIATLTRTFVEKVKGTGVKILDTRKTTPGLRSLERYAVRVGGGHNHRFDLSETVMVKDNHKALVPFEAILKKMRARGDKNVCVLEIKSLKEIPQALQFKAGYLQLDNMSLKEIREAVRVARGRAKLEATGGINLKNVASVAKTGVDYISIGALTHSAPSMDFSLEIQAR